MPAAIPIREIKAVTDRSDHNSSAFDQISALTDREQQVAFLVSGGLGNKDIARQLGLREGTVKLHVHNIFRKLGISRRFSLMNISID